MINSEAGKRCRSDERGLNWRQRGPRGPRGLQGIQGEKERGVGEIPGTGSSSVAYLSASSGEWRSGVHHLVDHGAGSIVRTVWYRVVVTTPAGACDSEPEAGSMIGNFEMNGGNANHFEAFNQTFLPGTTPPCRHWAVSPTAAEVRLCSRRL